MQRLLHRPFPAALLIGALAQALFSWRLTDPAKLYFDEVHYVPAARTLWALTAPANMEHPLVGKLLIGLSMWIAGDGPLGWRLLSTVAGTATVLGVFAILWLGLGRVRPAVLGSLFAVLASPSTSRRGLRCSTGSWRRPWSGARRCCSGR